MGCVGPKVAFLLVFAAGAVSAAVPVIDFETAEERKAAPRLNRKTYRFGVTNFCAASGKSESVNRIQPVKRLSVWPPSRSGVCCFESDDAICGSVGLVVG